MSSSLDPSPKNTGSEAAVPAGPGEVALAQWQQAVAHEAHNAAAWQQLTWHLVASGDPGAARRAQAQALQAAAMDPPLQRASARLCGGHMAEAEFLLREYLRTHPEDALVHQLLGEAAFCASRDAEAVSLLTRALQLAATANPTHDHGNLLLGARFTRAAAAYRLGDAQAARAEAEEVLTNEPRNPAFRTLLAAIYGQIGEDARSVELYAGLTLEYPGRARLWLSYGHMLKAVGRSAESVAAYRCALALEPRLGEAWWSLANLKTVRFAATDVGAMEETLQRADLSLEERLHLEFALGKAHEDARQFESSFRHYAEGNRLRLVDTPYSPQQLTLHVARSKQMLTPAFFAARRHWGCTAPDPIFIVGLPRSGSTLVEQILSSHSQVEGTRELPDVVSLASELAAQQHGESEYDYLRRLAELSSTDLRSLGEDYLVAARVHRKSTRPLFIDKMPNNFAHAALIHLMLPNARIIDVRRHPLASCLANFKQHFVRGQLFTYSLDSMARYYRDYVQLMAHLDTVLPGRIHRIHYEHLVADTAGTVRRLLEHCGLPFEDNCLQFHQNERVVRTPSSEQVRQPVFRDALDQWHHYRPWLEPAAALLGEVLETYP
jgi:Tfp pilus assembly protein PilF